MADKTTATAPVRRYVGRKETIAYVLNDVASSLGIIPKFFYPLSAVKKMQMYEELTERRIAMANFMKTASKEEVEKKGLEQLDGKFD